MWKNNHGFTVLEMMISIAMVGIMMASVVTTFSAQSKASMLQDRHVEMEDNLRVAMNFVTEAMRNAGYGVPRTSLDTWLSNGATVYGTSTVPLVFGTNTLKIGACTSSATTTVTSATTTTGVTTLSVGSTTKLAVNDTVWIGWAEFGKITDKTSSTITFDTNPLSESGLQGLYRTYPVGTPICRVDTETFTLSTANKTLSYNPGDGSGSQVLAENISAMTIEEITSRRRYRVTLTGTMSDPKTNQTVTQSISSDVVFVN